MNQSNEKYPRKFQWTLAHTKGIRGFPSWLAGAPEIWAYKERMSYSEAEAVDLCVYTNASAFGFEVHGIEYRIGDWVAKPYGRARRPCPTAVACIRAFQFGARPLMSENDHGDRHQERTESHQQLIIR